jgi:hypothetical protein
MKIIHHPSVPIKKTMILNLARKETCKVKKR